MCGCNSPEFMGVKLNSPAAQNAGMASELNPGQTFSTDSMNPLGVEGAEYRGANKRTDLNA
jgi:hypothetical protein